MNDWDDKYSELPMEIREVKISQVWLFGTRRIKAEWNREDAIKECQYTHPDGRLMDDPLMTEEEAAWMLDNDRFPDDVYKRLEKEYNKDVS